MSKYLVKLLFIVSCLTPLLIACSADNAAEEKGIYQVWLLERVISEDMSSKVIGENEVALVEIHQDYILESMGKEGKRRYPYERNENVLTLDPGLNNIEWEITKFTGDELNIETPIGVYILKLNPHK